MMTYRNIPNKPLPVRYEWVLSAIDQCQQSLNEFGLNQSDIMTMCVSLDIAYHHIGFIDSNTNRFTFNPPYYAKDSFHGTSILSISKDQYIELLVSRAKQGLVTRRYLSRIQSDRSLTTLVALA